jgi:hypothetical protein
MCAGIIVALYSVILRSLQAMGKKWGTALELQDLN